MENDRLIININKIVKIVNSIATWQDFSLVKKSLKLNIQIVIKCSIVDIIMESISTKQ